MQLFPTSWRLWSDRGVGWGGPRRIAACTEASFSIECHGAINGLDIQ